jgi:hypothetical protein
MTHAAKLLLSCHDVAELEMFRRYLADMHTMPFRKFYRKYQQYMGLSDAELRAILRRGPNARGPRPDNVL